MFNSSLETPEEEAQRLKNAETRRKEAAAFNALTLIEKNKIKLAELEKEWSALGSMREITFTVCFGEEDEANSLARAAVEKGFDTYVEHWVQKDYRYVLNATRSMEPVAEKVTFWEEWFYNQASEVPYFDTLDFDTAEYGDVGAYFEEWSYPERLTPAFHLKGDEKMRANQNALGAKARTRILFGQTLCNFEASNGWASKRKGSNFSPTFELVPSDFIKKARHNRPSNPEPTASMFSQWLYSLYANAYGDEQDRIQGKTAEKFIQEERQKSYATTDRVIMRKNFPDWQLKHNGLGTNQSERPNYYTINDLMVEGIPLRVLPDLIYENKRTRDIIIVEVKHSQMDIPSNLWPNIWGQLWCYSQMHEFRNSPNITVIGEVWGDKHYTRQQAQNVYLRASVRRNPRAIPYDRFFRTLFDIYCGAD